MRAVIAVAALLAGFVLANWLTAPAPTTPSDWQPFHDVDGHTGCEILVGATSMIRCADGFETTS